MATYSVNNFIDPSYLVDDKIKIRDIGGNSRITITNNTGTVFYTNGKNVAIKTSSEKNIILLDFSTNVEAIQALNKLKTAYSKVVENFNKKNDPQVEPKDIIFNSDLGNVADGQIAFPIPDGVDIFTVTINGVNITTYTIFNVTMFSNYIEIDIVTLGYGINSDDEVIIKYFS